MANLLYFGGMGLIIYKSSAGSGKTFTLVGQFLIKVLERPWLFKRILAITFTNKATEELKTRIIKELDILSSGGVSKYLELLLSELPKHNEAQIRQSANVVLTKILHDYSSFAVSTIDSYFQSLARTLARELLLPLKYQIELDTESICQNVADLLLDEAGKDPNITLWLEGLLIHRIDSGKSWNIRSELEKMTRELLNSDAARTHALNSGLDDLLELISWMLKSKQEVEQFMRQIGTKAIHIIKENHLDVNRFHYKSKGPAGYFEKIAKSKSGFDEFKSINSYVKKTLDDPLTFLSKQDQKDPSLCDFVTNKLFPLLTDAVGYFESNRRKYISVIEALKLIYQSGITGSLDNKLKTYREENQLFHLSDTTRMLSKTVAEQDAPFIYEKSGNTFQHIFIDEFQDTGTEQWNILKPLVINSLSTGNEVLLVGDAKQSIYRWRGGNMQLIIDGVKNEMMKTGFPVHDQNLDTNWRSKKEIVEFNNTFFPSAALSESLRFESGGNIYTQAYSKESVIQKTKGHDEEGGYIEFKFFESDKKDKNPESNIVHWKTKALLYLESTLEKLITSGYKPGDIAILVRTNFHENEISDFLFKNGKYAFISSNSLKLATHRTIGVLLNCMRILLHPEEALLHAEVNHFVKNMIEDSTIPFKSGKLFSENTSWTYHHLIKKKEHLNTLPLQLLYYHLLDQLNLNLTDPFIQKFSDILLDYTGSKGNNVSGFIKWWDEHVDTRNWSVELPGGGNAIRIITIHRSKGLEFPIVILPFLDWSLTPSSSGIIWAKGDEEQFRDFGKLPLFAVKNLSDSYFSNDYYQETLETAIDNLNLLYVAFTRPEEKLFVFGPKNPSENEVGRLVINTISENEKWGEKFIANEYKEFIIGEFHNKAQKEKISEKEGLYHPSGFTPINLPEYNGEYPVLPELKLAFTSKEIILGNLVHDTIAETTDERTIEKTVDLILSKNGNQAYYNLKEELTNQVKDVWRILDKQGWTSKDFVVVNEAELCDETGALHRPDKVLIKGQEAIIIDFKTGIKDPKHHVQVKEYCRLLRETGLQNISAYLLYTIDKEIVKIDWPETNVTGRITLFD